MRGRGGELEKMTSSTFGKRTLWSEAIFQGGGLKGDRGRVAFDNTLVDVSWPGFWLQEGPKRDAKLHGELDLKFGTISARFVPPSLGILWNFL